MQTAWGVTLESARTLPFGTLCGTRVLLVVLCLGVAGVPLGIYNMKSSATRTPRAYRSAWLRTEIKGVRAWLRRLREPVYISVPVWRDGMIRHYKHRLKAMQKELESLK